MNSVSLLSPVWAGFPSPSDIWDERPLDLQDLLAPHPESTFYACVRGNSMCGAGIDDTDILIVDRALEAVHGSIVLALVNGSLTVKRLMVQDRAYLQSEPVAGSPLPLPPTSFEIWGVVVAWVRLHHPTRTLKLLRHEPGAPR